jgi:hypothetical protein
MPASCCVVYTDNVIKHTIGNIHIDKYITTTKVYSGEIKTAIDDIKHLKDIVKEPDSKKLLSTEILSKLVKDESLIIDDTYYSKIRELLNY